MRAEVVPDHGSSRNSATHLNLPAILAGKLDSGADADYFRLDFGEETNLLLAAWTSREVAVAGEVLDSTGQRIDVNMGRLPDGFAVQDDFSRGTYYLRVYPPEERQGRRP